MVTNVSAHFGEPLDLSFKIRLLKASMVKKRSRMPGILVSYTHQKSRILSSEGYICTLNSENIVMTIIKRTADIAYTPEQMFMLVNAIEDYPQFLPWCKTAEILSKSDDEVRATLCLARGALHKSFTTCNRLQFGKMIEVKLVSGPFKHLQGFWRFEELPSQGCRISLDLEFEFANKLVSLAIGPLFQQIANTLVSSFCERAHSLYGQKK